MQLATPAPQPAATEAAGLRLRLRVRGQVQGVGMRPTVHRLAQAAGLAGWVLNDAEGVLIEVQGAAAAVEAFGERLRREAPPLARITAVEPRPRPLQPGARGFEILATPGVAGETARTAVTPDTAPCQACLRELFEPAGRRWRHPFINCTHCGPRFTLTRHLPYDRASTSMAGFAMCADCAREYADPADRRFHAQPNACPACGPRLALHDARGQTPPGDALAQALAVLRGGGVLALKGAGGYQLLVDAHQPQAVAALRARKGRDAKPFALMVAGLASGARLARIDAAASAWLSHPARPIVLCPRRPGGDEAALPSVATGLACLGLMLPSTPLHLLLFHEAAGRPAGSAWLEQAQPLVLVATSANPGGEPIVCDDDAARQRLAGLADAWLVHDRAIVARADDSVLRPAGAARAVFVRRARGFVPEPVELAVDGPSVLAFGGDLKNTVCVTRGREAWVSPHVGSLTDAATRSAQLEAVERLLALLDVRPERVLHDLHPDFASTAAAQAWAAARGLPPTTVHAVQHHHAHAAAVAAEARISAGPLLALVLDGHGHGLDGSAWGGELLRLEGTRWTRLAHLQTLPLAGGDRAAREPWRVAAAALHALGRGDEIGRRFGAQAAAAGLGAVLASPRLAPPTSSAGRWFDAAAALAGLVPVARYEAEAAMQFESLAERHGPVAPRPDGWRIAADGTLELLELLAAVADDADPAHAAAVFHATLAAALVEWVAAAAAREGVQQLVLGGGCLANGLLAAALADGLRERSLQVWQAQAMPPGDGGLSLGQAWLGLQQAAAPG